ncbi:RNA polymerase sigma factor [Pseudoflavitalea rhizosphaerae]|uniref:RNA polymerase sigma factor n=1 Tax=Pseudoflavitalea rhizosphaerae TaxID=1884793 RepID=UPI000F8D3272|nr:RNA polymerase sigma-70 factor [Pseudoflavitalea rhizosphaerae]
MPAELLHTSQELLNRIAAGDQEAFASLHHQYWDECYGLALAFLKSPDQAEDVVQDVFLKLWVKRSSLPAIKDFTPYFMVMVRNEIINYLRQLAQRQKKHAQYVSDNSVHLQQFFSVSDADTASIIQKALSELTERQQQIFSLSRDNGLSHEEIAEQLGLSKKTVSNTITQVLNHLRITLYQHGLMAWLAWIVLKR